MPNTARLTDLWAGICCCHSKPPCVGMSGPVVTASGDTITNNLGTARRTDVVIGFCGHAGLIVAGSPNVFVNNLEVARLGDPVAGCTIGVLVTGSGDTIAN